MVVEVTRSWQTGVITFAIVLALTAGYGIVRLATAPAIGSLDIVPVASFTVAENHMGELNKLLEEEGVARNATPLRNLYQRSGKISTD